MVLSVDHITGATGKTVTVKLSKSAASGVTASGTVTEVDSTNFPGLYSLAGNATDRNTLGELDIHATASGCDPIDFKVDIVTQDMFASNLGLSHVSSNADQWAGTTIPAPSQTGVPITDPHYWNGTAVASPATAGIPEVDVKNINNVATSSVTTISANQGTTQPVNFTGAGASALAKSDVTDIAGSAVSTSTAQLGVNAVNWAGGAIPAPAVTGVPKIDLTYVLGTILTQAHSLAASFIKWFDVTTPTSTMNEVTLVDTTTNLTNAPTAGDFTATMKTSLNAATPASVTGAVGSVTGNVGGNVVGSVGSVLGIVSANLTQILGTALTETAGQIAAGFKKFFNVAVPVMDLTSANQTGDSFGRLGIAGVGLTNLGDARLANLDTTVSSRLPTADLISDSGTAQAGSTTSIQLRAGAPAVNLTGQTIFIQSGTGVGQSAPITAYNTSTKTATTAWTTAPDGTSVYVVIAAQGGSSGGGSDPWATTFPGSYTSTQFGGALADIKTQADKITSGGVVVTGLANLAQTQIGPILSGNDYYAADGSRGLTITSPYGALPLTGCVVVFKGRQRGQTVSLQVTGNVLSASQVNFDLSASVTAKLQSGFFSVEQTLSNNHVITIAFGQQIIIVPQGY